MSAGLTATLVAVALLAVSPRLTAAAPAEGAWSGVGQGDFAARRAAPPNDNFANATVLTGALVTVENDTNDEATKQAGEPNHAGDVGGASVWYRWTPTASGTATIDTFESSFDTLLAAYTGGAVNSLTVVASNDDAGADRQSQIVFAATAGTIYRIAVDGYSGGGAADTGSITLHLSLSTGIPSVSSFLPTSGPVGTSVVITGTNVIGATAVKFNGTAASVFTVDSATQITATVPDGATSGPISVTTPGGTGTSATSFTVTAPPNNDFANAQVVSGSAVTRLGDTNIGGTKQAGEPDHAGNVGGASVWYRWTPATSGPASIDTFGSDFDTLLAAYTGGSVGGLTVVASNDDTVGHGDDRQSQILFAATAGTTYQIAVDGFNSGTGASQGTITLHVNLTVGPTVSSFLPTSGPVGTSVVVTGTNLTTTSGVAFNGTAAPDFSVDSDTQVTVTVPAGATTGPIAVTTPGGTATSSTSFTVTPSPAGHVPGDYDGNGTTDMAVFRPSTGVWYVRNGASAEWGTTGDIPVPGDYNGDGTTDMAVFRPGSGATQGYWYIRGQPSQQWGLSTDIPVPGDYDGNGTTDIAVFRPSTGVWYVRNGTSAEWGTAGDIPVPGDYNGDGTTDMAVFRPGSGATQGTWYVRNVTNVQWGVSTDIPVPGDYNGDGTTELAVFRPGSGVTQGIWYIRNVTNIQWGVSTDVPVPGDYDGDNTTDLAVFRPGSGPTQGTWYVRNVTNAQWGVSTDTPLSLPSAIYGRFFP